MVMQIVYTILILILGLQLYYTWVLSGLNWFLNTYVQLNCSTIKVVFLLYVTGQQMCNGFLKFVVSIAYLSKPIFFKRFFFF